DKMYDPEYAGTVDGSLKSVFGVLAAAKLGTQPQARDVRHLRALYQGEVSFNDAQLARLLDEIERQQLNRSTLFVLTSDHGEEFYEHGFGDHGHSLYEELIHIPLIMHWPGTIAPAAKNDELVQLLDLSPTLSALAGAKSATASGRDFSDALRGRSTSSSASRIFAEEHLDEHNLRAVVVQQRKLIVDLAQHRQMSFDLEHDPGELRPLGEPLEADLTSALSDFDAVLRSIKESDVQSSRPTQLPESARQALEALGYGDATKHP
ncbi:MAG TPA: sulfatase-like hydrolase/transferase, partial [Candidatus Acidoferrales bacterium]|nr:sulfatase-like hydrolase/transferase [Candidatus Acidoferrales bacterium]